MTLKWFLPRAAAAGQKLSDQKRKTKNVSSLESSYRVVHDAPAPQYQHQQGSDRDAGAPFGASSSQTLTIQSVGLLDPNDRQELPLADTCKVISAFLQSLKFQHHWKVLKDRSSRLKNCCVILLFSTILYASKMISKLACTMNIQ